VLVTTTVVLLREQDEYETRHLKQFIERLQR
jgi:hypothetical protein